MPKIVGFSNGCFQLLHKGHLHLLATARTHCDVLIVGINSDASIKRLKGAARLYQGSQARRRALLPYCDAVIEFSGDSPFELICNLKPDVLIRGDEGDTPIGAQSVWKTILVPKLEGYSTTGIVRRRA